MARKTFKSIDPSSFFNTGEPLPYITISLRGEAGSGKSYTGGIIANGIHKLAKCEKGIIVVDTEQSLKFLRPLFVESGIRELPPDDPDNQLWICSTDPETGKNPTFADVCRLLDWMNDGFADMMIIDSMTKIHRDFMESFKEKKYGKAYSGKIKFQDYPEANSNFRDNLTDRLVHGRGHKIICGRLGNKYEFVDTGSDKKELVKTGHKMAGDSEMAYEADINLEMRLIEELNRTGSGGKKLPDRVFRVATILKSRFPKLDGKTLNMTGKAKGPKFADFEEAIKFVVGDGAVSQKEIKRTDNLDLLDGTQDEDDQQTTAIIWQRFKAEVEIWIAAFDNGGKKTAGIALLADLFEGEKSLAAVKALDNKVISAATGELRRRIKARDLPGAKETVPDGFH